MADRSSNPHKISSPDLSVGELFVLGFRGREIPDWLRDFADEFGLGGVILFDYDCTDRTYERNILSPPQLYELCAEIHALPSRPLIFVDQEGGKVRRLKSGRGFCDFPSAKVFATLPLPQQMELTEAAFKELKEIGIDCNLAPVVDLDLDPTSPDLGLVERSYSADPSTVKKCAKVLIDAASTIGLGLCLKHFPGIGGAKVNSHTDLTDISDSLSEAQLEMFRELLAEIPGQMILFSHGIVNQWEKGVPVSMSEIAVKKVRDGSPDAIVISDDMQMEGLQKLMSTEDACIKAVRAGVDILCIGNNLKDEQTKSSSLANSILKNCKEDEIMKANVQSSIASIQNLKRQTSAR